MKPRDAPKGRKPQAGHGGNRGRTTVIFDDSENGVLCLFRLEKPWPVPEVSPGQYGRLGGPAHRAASASRSLIGIQRAVAIQTALIAS